MEGTTTVANILTSAGEIVTSSAGWVVDFTEVITSNPLILTFVLIPIGCLGIGVLKRLIKL